MPKMPETEYEHEEDEVLDPVEGSGGEEGQDGSDEAEDAAIDPGEEQEAGGREDVDPEPPSRGETRIQRLANENKELQRRLSDLERRPATQQPTQPQEESDEHFNARVQVLPPDERMEQRQIRSERRFNQQVAALRFHTQIQQDKLAYDTKAATDPRYKRYAAEVEAKHAEFLSHPTNPQLLPRAEILKWLIGERIVNGLDKDAEQQRQRSKRNVQRQQVKPTGARSDVASSRGRVSEAEARRRRLENMDI